MTSAGQGQKFGDGGAGNLANGISTSRLNFAVSAKLKKPDRIEHTNIITKPINAPKPKAIMSSVSRAAPRKAKAEKLATYFSASTKPTVENAITQIKKSKFGKTKSGKFVIDKIERLRKAGKIVIADTTDASGNRLRGKWDYATGILTIDTKMAGHVNDIASELIHEAAHALLSAQYARTGRKPDGNSIEQETLTNGYQLQLYREQRKYRKDKDFELERRLKESNKGMLRQNIRTRYATAQESQPKSK